MPAVCGFLLLLAAAGWWRLTADPGTRSTAPGTLFFAGLLVIGTLCVACEARAIATTRHQLPDDEDAGTDIARLAAVWRGLGELAVAAVAAVGIVLGVVLVLVAVVGLGAHAIAG